MKATVLPAALPENFPSPLRRITTASVASVFLPKEHGSWSLAFEPLALGLLVAPSPAGVALATAALAGFFARRPLKAALASGATVRRRTARITLVVLTALILAGLGEAVLLGGFAALWPLLIAAPLGGLFVWLDAQNDSRAAAAELAGSTAFALLPAAFATLAGWLAGTALALAAVALGRSGPTVLTVRAYLRRSRQQPAGVILPLLAGGLAAAVLGFLTAHHLVPWLAAALAALLFVRAVFFMAPFRPAWPAKRVGLFEAVLGAGYVGVIVLAYRLR